MCIVVRFDVVGNALRNERVSTTRFMALSTKAVSAPVDSWNIRSVWFEVLSGHDEQHLFAVGSRNIGTSTA